MGTIAGKFSDQNPIVLSQQLITARTTVKTDLNVIAVENDQVRTTNAYLQAQAVGNNAANIASAVTLVGQGTIGAAQSSGQITPSGQPCHIGTTWIDLPGSYRRKYISNIEIDDSILAFDPFTGQRIPDVVIATQQHRVEEYLRIEFEDGHVTGVDADGDPPGSHNYWIRDGAYRAIGTLECVWQWKGESWQPRNIVDKRIVKERTILYNFTTLRFHNYSANGNAVSNSKQPLDNSNDNQLA